MAGGIQELWLQLNWTLSPSMIKAKVPFAASKKPKQQLGLDDLLSMKEVLSKALTPLFLGLLEMLSNYLSVWASKGLEKPNASCLTVLTLSICP